MFVYALDSGKGLELPTARGGTIGSEIILKSCLPQNNVSNS